MRRVRDGKARVQERRSCLPESDSMIHRCEWDHCARAAQVWLNVQWTLFDWLHAYACRIHMAELIDYMQRRRVDGQTPVEITVHPYG